MELPFSFLLCLSVSIALFSLTSAQFKKDTNFSSPIFTEEDDSSGSEEQTMSTMLKSAVSHSTRLLTSLGWGEGSRRQDVVPEHRAFPCAAVVANNSLQAGSGTSSVHRLRPRDIAVVATLGDSLVTGFGALAESIPELFRMDQGVSWTIGGAESWRSTVTVPNLLREFNPRLVGFARSGGRGRHLGMGEPQSHDEHLLRQARRLVDAVRANPAIDIKRDWKLVTVLAGHNDLCSGDPCFPDPEAAGREHARSLQRALDYLHAHLPRTFVSLLSVLDVTAGWRIEKSLVCGMMSIIECRCLYASGDKADLERMRALVQAFHRAETQLVTSGRYDTREDFTVELQPFTAHIEPPRARNFLGFVLADLSLFSVDCFHLSQKGHAAFATMQWNNLLQPEGNKSSRFLWPLQELACPSRRAPFLFTRRNSRNYLTKGHQ